MGVRWCFLAGILMLLLVACAKPVPEDKKAYIGEWKAPGMYLLILDDGSVKYQRIKGGGSVSVNGPLKEFNGDNFLVGVGPFTTTFVVAKVPALEGSTWKMVVDGVELTKQ
jgi:hypothetical protein